MSSMAKIFVVVNLFLVIATFGAAATLLGAKEDYKSALAEFKDKFEAYQSTTEKTIDDLRSKVTQQTNKAAQEFARAQGLRGELDDVAAKLAAAATSNETLRSTVDTLTQEVAKANRINEDNKNWLDRLQGEVKKSTQDSLNWQKMLEDERSNRGSLEQQVENQNEEMQEVSAKLGDCERGRRELEFWLNEYRKRYGDITGISQGSKGVVNAVKGNLVSISVGSADGVRQGDTYHIRRGGSYVGMIRIETVEKNQAVGTFDTDFPGPGAPPQNGDVAYPGN